MRRALILLLLALAARPAAAQDLSGAWFGERWAGTRLVQHLSQRGADGRFSVRFRFFTGCRETGGQQQAGRWSAAGEEFHAVIETVDGAAPRAPGGEIAITYVIEDLRGDRMAYRGPDGTLHRAFRVPADYAMPPPLGCAPTS
ncbi:MAG: hypothetical protein K2X74_23135 [Acetobacteraceae bacterium]|nr:hypothetical protein [Acetobacteraceae bacterium]